MQDPRPQAQALVRDDHSSLCLLWVWYRGNGGEARLEEFDAYVHGLVVLDAFDLKILTWAMEDYEAACVFRL
ncbi:hypothetical protein M1D93_14660 [Arthrobacter sp. Z1-9]